MAETVAASGVLVPAASRTRLAAAGRPLAWLRWISGLDRGVHRPLGLRPERRLSGEGVIERSRRPQVLSPARRCVEQFRLRKLPGPDDVADPRSAALCWRLTRCRSPPGAPTHPAPQRCFPASRPGGRRAAGGCMAGVQPTWRGPCPRILHSGSGAFFSAILVSGSPGHADDGDHGMADADQVVDDNDHRVLHQRQIASPAPVPAWSRRPHRRRAQGSAPWPPLSAPEPLMASRRCPSCHRRRRTSR